MKKLISFLLTLSMLLPLSACGSKEDAPDTSGTPNGQTAEDTVPVEGPANGSGKILVVYFSATGHTKAVAEALSAALDADLYEIVPEEPYTSDDLNYSSDHCRANQEQNDDSARPAISGSVDNMDDYGIVFLGYPIWWGKEPKIVDTFLESYDLTGKTLIPFCTSGSSGISGSLSGIKAGAPGANVLDGQRFSGSTSPEEVRDWVDTLYLTK